LGDFGNKKLQWVRSGHAILIRIVLESSKIKPLELILQFLNYRISVFDSSILKLIHTSTGLNFIITKCFGIDFYLIAIKAS